MRTLTARILLGFAVLIVTFGAVSVLTILNTGALSRDIMIIRKGSLEFALATKDLYSKQVALFSYLSEEIVDETSPGRAKRRLLRLRVDRDNTLAEVETALREFESLLVRSNRTLRAASVTSKVRSLVEEQSVYYGELVLLPPLDSFRERPLAKTDKFKNARKALAMLRKNEHYLEGKLAQLARSQAEAVKQTATTLEDNGRRVRWLTIYLGITSTIVGILIALWAIITLRSLSRLGEAARRIGQGEYGSKIEVAGPSDIAGLATEFNSMSDAIKEREGQLRQSEKLVAVGKMAAIITHEVRNPLSAIALNAELLDEELTRVHAPQEAITMLTSITTEVDRLTGITEEYLQFARLPSPKLQVECVDDIVQSVVDFQYEVLRTQDIVLTAELKQRGITAFVDEQQLRQAILNLLRNAGEAMDKQGGTVVLEVDSSPQDAIIRVIDSGGGISEEVQRQMFEPFYSTKDGGTGLGLALVQQILRAHKGSVNIETSTSGTQFTLRLPRRLEQGVVDIQ